MLFIADFSYVRNNISLTKVQREAYKTSTANFNWWLLVEDMILILKVNM